MKSAHTRRNHGRPWTPEHDRLLRRNWGASERLLRDLLGRTAPAIRARASALRLGSQSRGLVAVSVASQRLGLSKAGLETVLREFGVRVDLRAPVPQKWFARAYRHRVVELDQVEELFAQRERRTTTQQGWCVEHGRADAWLGPRLARLGVPSGAARRARHRVPIGVFDEVAAGAPGRWCAVWRAALASAAERPVCAPWLLALIAWDLALPEGPADWIEPFAPTGARQRARLIAERVFGLARETRDGREAAA